MGELGGNKEGESPISLCCFTFSNFLFYLNQNIAILEPIYIDIE